MYASVREAHPDILLARGEVEEGGAMEEEEPELVAAI